MICGRKPKLRPDQQAELLAWNASRKTLRQKASELGIGLTAAKNYIRGVHKQPIRA